MAKRNATAVATVPNDGRKVYVLCPSVLIHDPRSITSFAEHHVVIPLFTLHKLHELEAKQETKPEQAVLACEATQFILEMTGGNHTGINGTKMYDLEEPSGGKATGTLSYYRHEGNFSNIVQVVLEMLRKTYKGREDRVVLVTKNVTTQAIARASGFAAEDYRADMVSGTMRSGICQLPPNFFDIAIETEFTTSSGLTKRAFLLRGDFPYLLNEYVYLDGERSFAGIVRKRDGVGVIITEAVDYTKAGNHVYGVAARNRGQNALLNLCMDPDIVCISTVGLAGSGKTLLGLAAGFAQSISAKGSTDPLPFDKIMYIRAQVGVGSEKDMGAVGGGKEKKLAPWSMPVDDNIKALAKLHKELSLGGKQNGNQYSIDAMQKGVELEMTRMVRGRSMSGYFIIIDEAQNLTPHQIKTLVSRAGPGSKFILVGDLTQIDSLFLNPRSCGLSHVIYRFQGCEGIGHVELKECERSYLSNLAATLL